MQDQQKDQTLFDDLEIPLVKLEIQENDYHHRHSRNLPAFNPIQPPIISRSLPPLESFQNYYPYENPYFPYHPIDIFDQGYKSEYDDYHSHDRFYMPPIPPIPLINSSNHQPPPCPQSPLSPQEGYYPDLPPAPGYVPVVEAPPNYKKSARRPSIQSTGYSTDEQSADSEFKSKRVQVKKACGKIIF